MFTLNLRNTYSRLSRFSFILAFFLRFITLFIKNFVILQHFLRGEPILGIDYKAQLQKTLLPGKFLERLFLCSPDLSWYFQSPMRTSEGVRVRTSCDGIYITRILVLPRMGCSFSFDRRF